MKLKTLVYFFAGAVLVLIGFASFVLLTYNVFLQFGVAMGSWTAFGVFLFYVLTSVPTFEGAGAWIANGLSAFNIGKKNAVALKIEHELNTAQELISSQAKGIMPYPAKVEWIEKPSYLDTDEEKVIIRMREHNENPRNVAFAVVDYVSKGMIPFSRLYITKPIQNAIDATIVKSILHEKDESALDFFLTHVLNQKLTENGVQHYLTFINNINKRGLLTRVLLQEFNELGRKLYPVIDQNATRETTKYVEQLHGLSTRVRGVKHGADPFIGNHIKVAYVLIAEPLKILTSDEPYLQYPNRCLQDGAEVLYLLSCGVTNKATLRLANKIAKLYGLHVVNSSEYNDVVGKSIHKALCVELRKNT